MKPLTKRPLGRSGLEIAPLVFGGNVFGWTVDEPTSFALLDRFVDAGLNAIDTADVYSAWAPGNRGGESETIIGKWLAADPTRRDRVVIITKAGAALKEKGGGLSAANIVASAERSLRRLQTDRIDLYFAHYPDPVTPIDETLRAFETLIAQGKVRAIGASNYDARQLQAALAASARNGLPRYDVIQPEYNLCDRTGYDGPLRDLAVAEGLGVITYYSLASGFLSGKYRSRADLDQSPRGARVAKYLDRRGERILQALEDVARAHGAALAEVALAWLIGREDITAPIASATRLEQLDSLVRSTRLHLTPSDRSLLDAAGTLPA
jgi:aryl-alcohol dehydrogenase-like predicted oxidoreductase